MTESQAPSPAPRNLAGRAQEIARRPRVRKAALWTVGIVVAFGAFGFLAAPPIAKSLLESRLGEALHRKVSIGGISINPYVLSARIEGFSVTAEDHEVFGFDSLYVNLQASSILRGGPVVQEVKLDGPRVHVTRVSDDRYDISDLIDEWSKPSDSPTPKFAVNNIQVGGGKVTFVDKPAGVSHEVTDLALRLPFVSSLPYQTDIYVEPHFSAQVNGSPLVLEGRSKPFKESHESELSLDLDRADLVRYLPYSPVKLPFAARSGTLDTELKLIFSQGNGAPAAVRLTGAVHVKNLDLDEAGGQPLVSWKQLDIALAEADLLKRHFVIDKVSLAGLENHLRATPQGTLNWLDIVQHLQGNTSAKPAAAAAPAEPMTWLVKEVAVSGATQFWRDESRGKAFEAAVRDIEVTARGIDSAFAGPVEVDAAWSIDGGQQFRLKRGEIKGAAIDVGKRQAHLGQVTLSGAEVQAIRDAKGVLDLPQGPLLKAAEAPAPAGKEAPWVVSAARLALAAAALRYEDRSLKDKSVQVIDNFSVTVDDFSTAPGKKATLAVDGRINQKGALKTAGDLQLQPLAANLEVDITGLPLLPVQPFFTDRLNVTLVRGQVSAKGKVALAEGKDGYNGGYKGQVTLGDLHTIDKLNSTDLLKWKSLYIGGIDAKLQPFALNVGEIALSDFYARMIVTPEGKLNLSQIVRKPGEEEATTTVPAAPAKPAEAPPPAPAAQARTAAAPAKAAPPVAIGRVTLQGGTVNFSDFFVKPNYTVNVTKIVGSVKGLSSAAGTLADMELRGSYGNAAPVEVSAKLNPLAAKAHLDLKGEIRGVDLTTLSTYSGKYAGYAIDKGKLSLYVTYKLADNQLNAENRVFLDQLTFGDKVDSPDATSLPVKLAVALLKNGRGEIDINLPISGSLDDPDFSVGGIIVRVIVNLFVKAVTSPFALLGSLFGGGAELSNVEFDAGYATLAPAAVKKLEALAKAMNDRPALKLEVAGRVDPETDREGSKRAAIDRAVRAEKLKEQVKKGIEGGSVDTVTVDAKEYPEYLQRAYKAAKFPKPRNLIGLQKDLPVEEMEKLMLANLPVGEEDLRLLAERRAEAVQAWLVEQGKVPMERVFLMPPKLGRDDKGDGKASSSRAEFSLR